MFKSPDYENAFMMWELDWSNFRMYLKMHLHWIGVLAILQGFLITVLSYIFLPALQRQLAFSYIVGNIGRLFFFNPTFTLDLPNGGQKVVDASSIVSSVKAASAAHWSIFWMAIIFLASCSVYLLLPVIAKYYSKKGGKYFGNAHIRGVQVITEEALSLLVKASGVVSYLMIGNVPWPFDFETEHLIIYGKTRVGKTVLMFQLMFWIRAKNAKAICLDVKLDYIAKWYDASKGDLIFNILDERSVALNLFNEAKTLPDAEGISFSIIPEPKGSGSNEVFFCDAARAVFNGAYHNCLARDTKQMSELRQIIFSDTKLLHDAIEQTKAGERGAKFISQDTSALAGSVMAVLTQYCGWMDYISDESETSKFSLIDWVTDGKPGFLYVASNDDVEKVLRPAITLAFDLVVKKLNALPDDRNRRLYVLMDEFSSLNRLSSIVNFFTKSGGKGGVGVITSQDFPQMISAYGKEHAQTLNNSFGSVAILKTRDPDTAEYLSKGVGRTEYWEWQTTHTRKTSDEGDGSSSTRQKRDEAAITATEIQTMKKLEYILQIPDYEPARGKLKIMDVNNLPQINEPFVMRPGLSLSEVYKREKVIERITEDLGFGPKSRDKEKEEALEEDIEEDVKMKHIPTLDSETAIRLVIEDTNEMKLF